MDIVRHDNGRNVNFYGLEDGSGLKSLYGLIDRFRADYMYDYDESNEDNSPYGSQSWSYKTMFVIFANQPVPFSRGITDPLNSTSRFACLLCTWVHILFRDGVANKYWGNSIFFTGNKMPKASASNWIKCFSELKYCKKTELWFHENTEKEKVFTDNGSSTLAYN